MADINGTAVESPENKARASDALFMMECMKHLQTPATIDIAAVAKALNYSHTGSVANRIRGIKKRFNLQQHLTCSNVSAGGEAFTLRKGAKVSSRPIKTKMESAEEGGGDIKTEKAKAGRKPCAKQPRKPKAPVTVDDIVVDSTAIIKDEEVSAQVTENVS
ncbi:hypothetical protein PABG_07349 [Paracoccidioides brasiliensis Pb03]|uniref:Myb-like DNA-binding domain-containing protein n=1 Tax=Paracoccidioides brasiliensis (strain Pb18) TaxID=502780 RepID=C1GM29_PARBD|nr:uncharacterized protein PADG_08420 [Paracoccidioides brasiliensis Pb18]EEH17262.1 hypothetical protein PABG_07349 [Paracoccidioides brasiliensis Pb03]EEH43495.1 hypothetical protein PADG_08420 [Paracoccidioides brasiliensis Pb18]ODH45935.1 hypothetical protein GX48_07976 [Paracoccidioides brasiliensis]